MRKWLLAARLQTLYAIISPVIIGSVLAHIDGSSNLFLTLVILLAAILIQIGTNFVNDVYDYEKGSDNEDRLGPIRVTQSGLISPKKMKIATILIFVLAILIGIYLVNIGGVPILLIGILSIISGVAYTAGPYPIGYVGLGDIFVFIFFGLIAVSGTYYLHTNEISGISLLLGVGMGMLSNALLVINNLRDIETDKKSGKKTLAVRFGYKFSRIQYIFLIVTPVLVPIYLWYIFEKDILIIIMLFLFIISVRLATKAFYTKGKNLNYILFETSQYQLFFTILICIGMLI